MKRKWSVRSAARVTGATITGVLAVAALALVGVSEKSIDFGEDVGTPIREVVSLPDQTYELACVLGMETEFGDTVAGDLYVLQQDGVEIQSATNLATGKEVAASGSGQALTYSGSDPIGLTVHSTSPVSVPATIVSEADTEDVRGVVLDACKTARNYAWFTAGSTTIGEAALLTVANPSSQATEVELRGWSSTGPLETSPAFTVRAQSAQTVNLSTFFPEEERLALEVHASGPGVVSTLRTSSTDGLTPRGFDQVSGRSVASTDVTILGIESAQTDPKLRIINMGEETAAVSVDIITAQGTQPLEGTEDLEIDPQAVFQLSLDGLEDDFAGVILHSEQPLLASASATIEGSEGEDEVNLADRIEWMPLEPAQNFHAYLPEREGSSYALFLANTSDAPVEVSIAGATRTIPAGTVFKEGVEPGDLSIEADTPIFASINMRTESENGVMYSSLALQDAVSETPTISLVTAR